MRKQKIQQRTIVQKPVHRLSFRGSDLNLFSSHNIIIRASRSNELTDSALKAFKKANSSKRLRKLFISRAIPYHELTKKPAEVRMGKGRGVKIQKRIFPFPKGRILFEFNLKRRQRLFYSTIALMKKAAKKLPFPVFIGNTDL
jgi:ribosomal protein L16/L10AE